MNKLLKFNPKERLTVEEALEHTYVSQFHNIDNEPVCNKVISIPIDDNKKFSIKEYRLKIYTDIHKRKKELRKKNMIKEQLYYQKAKAAAATTQYGRGYPKKDVAEPARPATTHGKASFKRSSTAKYASAVSTAATKAPADKDKEKYKKYYQAKSYKM